MKSLRPGLLAIAILAVCNVAQAQFAATYEFANSISAVPTVANVTFTPLTATNTSVSRLSGALASSSGWITGGGSADPSEFLAFSLNSNSGYTLDITSLTFKASVSSSGPPSMSVALYIGGILQETSGTYNPVMTSTATTAAMGTAMTFDFADKTGIVSSSLAEFRIYGWGGSGASGTLRLDDLSINGSVNLAAIPEPSTYAMILGVLALTGVAVRRRCMPRAA